MRSRFSEKWLETACGQLPGVVSAVFMVPDRDRRQMKLLAKYPADLEHHQDFFATVKFALARKSEVCLAKAHVVDGVPMDYFAKPIFLRSRLVGVLVMKMAHLPVSKHLAVFQSFRRSIRWLGLANAARHGADDFHAGVIGMSSNCFESQGYRQGMARLVDELARKFECDRVAFAEYRKRRCRVLAISAGNGRERNSRLARCIEAAMDEAISPDKNERSSAEDGELARQAHHSLARESGYGSVATIPMLHEQRLLGIVTLLRRGEQPLAGSVLQECRRTLAVLTPYIALKRAQETGMLRGAMDGAVGAIGRVPLASPIYLLRGMLALPALLLAMPLGVGERIFRFATRAPAGARQGADFPLEIIHADEIDRRVALVNRVIALHRCGRPVLLASGSDDESARVSKWLVEAGLPQPVAVAGKVRADALADPDESPETMQLVSGILGPDTISLLLGNPQPKCALHVVATGIDAWRRFDRRLYRRYARKTPGGNAEINLSLQEPEIAGWPGSTVLKLLALWRATGKPLPPGTSRLLFLALNYSRRDRSGRRRSDTLPATVPIS